MEVNPFKTPDYTSKTVTVVPPDYDVYEPIIPSSPDDPDNFDKEDDSDILLYVRGNCPSVKSDFARTYAREIGKLSSEGFITTYAGNGRYGNCWHITILGLELLVDEGVLSGRIEGILWSNRD